MGKVSYKDLKNQLKIAESRLKIDLFDFTNKFKVLKRSVKSKKKDYEDDEIISINESFKAKSKRINCIRKAKTNKKVGKKDDDPNRDIIIR